MPVPPGGVEAVVRALAADVWPTELRPDQAGLEDTFPRLTGDPEEAR